MSPVHDAITTTSGNDLVTTRVAVVGSINMDLVARCDGLPRPGQTVHAVSFSQLPGGKGANQAVAAARLGARCTFIGRVGDDSYGRQLTETLKQYGVHTAAVTVTPGTSSGLAWINVEQSGENAITIVAGSNGHLTRDDVQCNQTLIQSANVLIVQLEVPLEAVTAALHTATAAGVLTVLDPAPAPADNLPDELYQVDVMTPNQIEAESLTGVPVRDVGSAVRACHLLRERGVRRPIITLGADGAVFLDEWTKTPRHTVPPRVDVIDTTAAGDAFTAGLACRFAGGSTLAAAVRFGCAAGALATTTLGAQNAMPAWHDVIEGENSN